MKKSEIGLLCYATVASSHELVTGNEELHLNNLYKQLVRLWQPLFYRHQAAHVHVRLEWIVQYVVHNFLCAVAVILSFIKNCDILGYNWAHGHYRPPPYSNTITNNHRPQQYINTISDNHRTPQYINTITDNDRPPQYINTITNNHRTLTQITDNHSKLKITDHHVLMNNCYVKTTKTWLADYLELTVNISHLKTSP